MVLINQSILNDTLTQILKADTGCKKVPGCLVKYMEVLIKFNTCMFNTLSCVRKVFLSKFKFVYALKANSDMAQEDKRHL